jgi:protein tyrosine phosphatase (PTP) superfamily phosphohydrolase (DUF442 family)
MALIAGCGGERPSNRNEPASFGKATATTTDATAPSARGATQGPAQTLPEKVAAKHLPNPWRIHPKVISGGLPDGEAAFQELADLGIKTVISVDGARPDVALAKKYGMRYVHMPHGYDGVPEQRAKELAKAVRDLSGPIYIHCHHGKHRSPAAATVACVGAGFLSADQARIVLKAAGTSESYRGLYQSAESASQLDAALLDALEVEYPETVQLPPIAEAMIAIEHAHDNLKVLSANQWRRLSDQPDLDAAHEALLLREHYTELLRSDEVKEQSDAFRSLLMESEATAKQLEAILEGWAKSVDRSSPPDGIGKAFAAISQSCIACHKTFRDVPLSEKNRH